MYALRKTEPRDLEIIHGMLSALEEVELPFDAFQNIFLQNISSDDNLYLVAVDERGMIVGHFAMHTQWLLHHAGLVAEVQEMFVSPGKRSSGIGELMLKEALFWAREKKCVVAEVTANLKRTRTHQFYERSGFKNTHLKFTMGLIT